MRVCQNANLTYTPAQFSKERMMFELLLVAAACIGMARVAEEDQKSGLMWGGITFVLCVVSMAVIPLPFLRILIAGVAAFIIMAATSKN
jgi:hypothetical protein